MASGEFHSYHSHPRRFYNYFKNHQIDWCGGRKGYSKAWRGFGPRWFPDFGRVGGAGVLWLD
jgi:hypothetical protein